MFKFFRNPFKNADGNKMYKQQLEMKRLLLGDFDEGEPAWQREHDISYRDLRLSGEWILNDGVLKKPRYDFERRFLKVPVVLEWLAYQLKLDYERNLSTSLTSMSGIRFDVFHELAQSGGAATLGFRIYMMEQDDKRYVGVIHTSLERVWWGMGDENLLDYIKRHEYMIEELATGHYVLSDPHSPMVVMNDFVWHVSLHDEPAILYRNQTIALVLNDAAMRLSSDVEVAPVLDQPLPLKYRVFYEDKGNGNEAEIGCKIYATDEEGIEYKIGKLWMHFYFGPLMGYDFAYNPEDYLGVSKYIFKNFINNNNTVLGNYPYCQGEEPITVIDDDQWVYEDAHGTKTYYPNIGVKDIVLTMNEELGEVRYRVFYRDDDDDETTVIGFILDQIDWNGDKIYAGRLYLEVKYIFSDYKKHKPAQIIQKHGHLFNRVPFGDFSDFDGYYMFTHFHSYKWFLKLNGNKKITYENEQLDEIFKDMKKRIKKVRKKMAEDSA